MSRSVAILCLAAATLFATTRDVQARHWTIDGIKVNALIKDFNGTEALMQTGDGEFHRVALQRFSRSDVKHIRSMLELRQMTSDILTRQADTQTRRGRLILEQERFRSRWNKVWQVNFQAPNGQYFYRYYRGTNSAIAEDSARHEFPYARVLSVSKRYGGNRDRGWAGY